MNLILLFEEDFVPGSNLARLTGRRQRHVIEVHRAGVGAELQVGVAGGRIGRGRITRRDDEALELEVTLDRAPPAALPVTLVLALPRPKVLRRVLQASAAFGVKRIVLLSTWRVERSFWSSPVLEPAALREQLVLGLEQAGDTIMPEVLCRKLFKPFAEDELPALAAGTLPLVAHPVAAESCPREVRGAVTLAVGPEGGFIAYEVDLLRAHGFTPVSLGTRRLRVEQVVPALLARLF